MKGLYCSGIVLIALLCCFANAFAQSNKGTEFYTAWMDHVDGATGNDPSRMNLYLVSTVNTSGTVSITDGSFAAIPFTLIANEPQTIAIPAEAYLGESNNDAIIKKGIHIVADQPIAAYAHIYRGSVSGATLLLPVNTMGKEYYSINYTQLSNSTIVRGNLGFVSSYSVFNVIATEDATTVEIKPTAALLSGHSAGNTFQVTLNKGEVYQGLSSMDLTGTVIRSVSSNSAVCKKIAVFSGSSKIGIGCGGNINTGVANLTSDNLFQQVYPTEAWGKNYYAAPLKGRNYDVYRVIYNDPTANVTKDGVPLPAPTNGYYEFKSQTPVVIKSDKPIQLVQYTPSQGQTLTCGQAGGDVGDPEMIYLSPIEQGLKQVTLYSTSVAAIDPDRNFINVIIPAAAVTSFRFDGQAYNNFATMPGDAGYMYAQINAGPGKHSLSAAMPFNAVAYGFGRLESYGYAAGTNLQKLNEFIELGIPGNTSTSLTSGCANNTYNIQLAVADNNISSIEWRFTDGTPSQTVNFPPYSGTRQTADGTTLYIYRYNGVINKPAGYYGVIASIPNQGSTSGCGPTRDIEFYFNITDYPEANFTASADKCQGSTLQFTDASDTKGSTIVSWLWDFKDPYATASNPNTSTVQNPSHQFTVPGNYNVELTVINENGCTSVKKIIQVHISTLPVVKFNASTPNCATQAITFTDQSTTIDGQIVQWSWNFGDPNSTSANPNTSTDQNPLHVYTAPGTYYVTLQVTTSLGCTNILSQQMIKVNPVPVVDFKLPDACQYDVAKFENTSTIADGSEAQFTYEWDFGDGSAKTHTKDGLHFYGVPGTYMVTLKVTSKDGCTFTSAPKQFTLNGIIPTVKIQIANPEFCSTDNLVIEDQSIVNGGGRVIKYEIYYDYINHPTDFVTYDAANTPIPADKKFIHNYGFSTVTQDYRVRIVLYTGTSAACRAEYVKDIKVKANPLITIQQKSFTACQELGNITLATQEGNFAGLGTPKFTGAGITDDVNGIFNTQKAGPGTHTIHYVFTLTSTGCTYEDDFTIVVNPTPIVNGKREYTILEGESVTLEPQVLSLNRSKLTYRWSPRQGLSDYTSSSPKASPTADTQYQLVVTSDDQCTPVPAVTFSVRVLQLPITYNTFTPNGDGRNDTWVIPNIINFPKATVEVLNRNGERVFYSVGYPVPWDGRYKGADLPAGTYYYIIDAKNGKPVQSGPLTIIR